MASLSNLLAGKTIHPPRPRDEYRYYIFHRNFHETLVRPSPGENSLVRYVIFLCPKKQLVAGVKWGSYLPEMSVTPASVNYLFTYGWWGLCIISPC
jgi:hypothetical protein